MTIDKTGKSDSDWRRELTPERYRVLRQHGTEAPGASPLNHEKTRRRISLRRLRRRAVPVGHQI